MGQGHSSGQLSHLQEPGHRSGKEKGAGHSMSGPGMELGVSHRWSDRELGISRKLSGMELGISHKSGMESHISHR